MPWCHGCGYEYIAGVKRCPDCGLELRDALGLDDPDRGVPASKDRQWTVIREVRDPLDAQMIKGFLEARDIEVTVVNRDPVLTYFRPVGETGSLTLVLVPAESVERARLLLRTVPGWTDEDLTEYMDKHGGLEGGDDEEKGVDGEEGVEEGEEEK